MSDEAEADCRSGAGIAVLGPRGDQRGSRVRSAFSHGYVFADGWLAPISRALAAAEGAGFEVCDVESPREHCADAVPIGEPA